MAEHIEQTIAEFQKKLREQEQNVIKTKEMINHLCEFAGKPPMYSDADLTPTSSIATLRSDAFYGQPLASAVRRVLEMRQTAGIGPASVKDIYEGLKQGGYQFDTKNDQNAMRGLRVSLTKNAALFHKLPNGQFGLVSWYPKIKAARGKQEAEPEDIEAEAADSEEENEGKEESQ